MTDEPELRLEAWARARKIKGLKPPPRSCDAYAKRAKTPVAPKDVTAALAEPDADKRDAMLVALESGPMVDAVRLLRAESAPIECADAIIDPVLADRASVSGYAGHVLVGLSLAGKLSRTAEGVPELKDATDKERVKKFIAGPLRQWLVAEATAIDALAVAATGLAGPGRAIGAVEAGMADLRLVDRIRSAPTPASWDKELKAVYEAALDEALEPRKRRGRDAALVGLADFAADFVASDPRVDRARALLAKLYGGRRIDALDALMLPSALEPSGGPLATGSRARARWLTSLKLTNTPNLASTAEQRFALGQKYWRRVDFVEAAHLASAAQDRRDESRLILALSLALAHGGAANAQEMMAAPSPAALELVHTEALDALAAEGGKLAGMAAFNAALLRALSPPEAGATSYFTDVAARFRRAAKLLESNPTAKKRAEDRAAEIEATAKSLGG